MPDRPASRCLHRTLIQWRIDTSSSALFTRLLHGGWVTDEELQGVRDAGYGDGEINEIIATIAITIFSNYFNHVAETEVDFPAVELATAAAA